MKKTAIFLNGGAGRMISSIPAVEKYLEENPDKDPILVCEGGLCHLFYLIILGITEYIYHW